MGINHSLLPNNNVKSPLPFWVVVTLMFSCIIFINDYICILNDSPR